MLKLFFTGNFYLHRSKNVIKSTNGGALRSAAQTYLDSLFPTAVVQGDN